MTIRKSLRGFTIACVIAGVAAAAFAVHFRHVEHTIAKPIAEGEPDAGTLLVSTTEVDFEGQAAALGCNPTCNPGLLCCSLPHGCKNPNTDPANCGSCGAGCSGNNDAPHCTNGTCDSACNFGFADCNGNLRMDGCEINLLTDNNHCGNCSGAGSVCTGGQGCCWAVCTTYNTTTNCGACGNTCNTAHASAATCASSPSPHCTYSCSSGYGDCDASIFPNTDGCETNLNTDPNNCGGCTVACSSANIASPTCGSGICNGMCNMGFADCNLNKRTDGCEINLTNDINNCGGCGDICDNIHSNGRSCSGSTCHYTGCVAGYLNCDMSGLDTNGCETNYNTDPNNCGSCGHNCVVAHGTASCVGGACTVASCNPGYGDCNGVEADGCEAPLNTITNCSNCGIACDTGLSTGAMCDGTTCSYTGCASGWADCNLTAPDRNGCDTQVAFDVNNCGSCGSSCSSSHIARACDSGICDGTCSVGWADCDGDKLSNGCETDKTNVLNCGGCGNACTLTHATADACNGTTCSYTCSAGYADCNAGTAPDTDGCEVNLNTDANNCSSCGHACPANYTCSAGTCLCGGVVCAANQVCSGGGVCVCDSNHVQCVGDTANECDNSHVWGGSSQFYDCYGSTNNDVGPNVGGNGCYNNGNGCVATQICCPSTHLSTTNTSCVNQATNSNCFRCGNICTGNYTCTGSPHFTCCNINNPNDCIPPPQ